MKVVEQRGKRYSYNLPFSDVTNDGLIGSNRECTGDEIKY